MKNPTLLVPFLQREVYVWRHSIVTAVRNALNRTLT